MNDAASQEYKEEKSWFESCESLSLPCKLTGSHAHCKYCTKVFPTKHRCRRHFKQSHLSRVVKYDGKLCFPCKLPHGDKTSICAHYHCPVCQSTVMKQVRFQVHLNAHNRTNKESNKKSNRSKVAVSDLAKTCQKSTACHSEEDCTKTLSDTQSCPICMKVMDKRSIPRHCRDIHHMEIISTTVCVDQERGLYAVKKSRGGGVGYRIHVKKDPQSNFECEVKSCMDCMKIARTNGYETVECEHLAKVGNFPTIAENLLLENKYLSDLSFSGTYKVMTDSSIKACKILRDKAAKNNCPAIVCMEDGQRFLHFSVFHGIIQKYSKFGRVMVTADFKNKILDCRCCLRRRSCPHKFLCLWYMRQQGLIDDFRGCVLEIDGAND